MSNTMDLKMNTSIPPKKKVLIIGAGFGGFYTLRYLMNRIRAYEDVEVTLVNDNSYFLFAPILHEAATGVVEKSHIISPLWQPGNRFKFIKSEVTDIDLKQKKVNTTSGPLFYDYLVIGLGSVAIKSEIAAGSKKVYPMKTLKDISLFQSQLSAVFEEASVEKDPEKIRQLLTFVISGGGYAGVQLAATLLDVTTRYFTKYYHSILAKDIRVVLVESKERIMNHLPIAPNNYIHRHLTHSGIAILVNSQITKITDIGVEINGGDIIPSKTVIWTTGVQTNPLVAAMDLKKDDLGRLYVDKYLQLPEYPSVYVVGDCVHFESARSHETAAPRAHNAVRQARVIAYNLTAALKSGKKRQYHFKDSAEVISLGRFKALLRLGNRWIYGLPATAAFVLSYSILAVGKRNRFATLTDWVLSLFYGPYIAPFE